jgi:hypothetical protein
MVRGKNSDLPNGKVINSQAGMDKAVKSICDILRRDKAKGALLPVGVLSFDRLRMVTVRLCSPFSFVQGDPEFIEGSLSLHFVLRLSVEGSEVEGSKVEPHQRGMKNLSPFYSPSPQVRRGGSRW